MRDRSYLEIARSPDACLPDLAGSLLPRSFPPEAGPPVDLQLLRRLSSLTILHFCRTNEPLYLAGTRPEEILRLARSLIDRSPFLWLLESALLYPEKLALVDNPSVAPPAGSQTFNYAQLLLRSVSLAEGLGELGCVPGSRVAVLLHNCGAVLDVHFAACALGAAVVNLNTHLVARELSGLLASSAPQFIVCGADCALVLLDSLLETAGRGLDLSAVTVLWLGGAPAAAAALPIRTVNYEVLVSEPRILDARALADSLSKLPPAVPTSPYQIYFTSGTTGTPKTVSLSLDIVVTHALGTALEMRLHSDDVWVRG